MNLTRKQLMEIQIAIRLDDYLYEKDTKAYFDRMPVLDLAESQRIFINEYLEILENKDSYTKMDFEKILTKLILDNKYYQELLDKGSKSSLIRKYCKVTERLVNQMTKYKNNY